MDVDQTTFAAVASIPRRLHGTHEMTTMDCMFWPRLALGILAAWRLTHLLAYEDGPADAVARVRALLGSGVWGRMVDCFQCLSLWVAAPIALWITDGATVNVIDTALTLLAVSGAACLLERIGQPAVTMHTTPEPGPGDDDGMLRTKT
ncbi:hypothetical protein BH11PSE8_BH11PSE8_21020 [soil metagenome]